ncbi:MAG TPA: hypothetical protein DCZ94_04295 [Lentisphaeria bacterium]|nr:MAG: hypothetical protein A2X48_05515 [Lentisphaerae bacterium GWF2_49_21]HBC86157.1 hypothetical protein [Lentisphaeria bacterium]
MKYIVKGDDEKEYGPVDEETLRKWTEAGRILPHTQVRNTLIRKWNKATDFDFLKPAFALQQTRVEEEKNPVEKFSERLNIIIGGRKKTPETLTPYATAFKNKYVHDPATLGQRLSAMAFDLLVLLFFGFILLLSFAQSLPPPKIEPPKLPDATVQQDAKAPDKTAVPAPAGTPVAAPVPTPAPASAPAPETATAIAPAAPIANNPELNASFKKHCCIFVIGVLLYYGISLGLFAQTFGMWFWGIMISCSNLEEVYMGRAYLFTVLMFILGILTPIMVLVNPYKRALHEMLSGTMMIKIAARPKA